MIDSVIAWLNERTTEELAWLVIGFAAQAMFMMRFVVQWIASERARRSIVPELFWYFSVLGGALLLGYSLHREDPVFIAGQALGLVIYLRNLYFIWTNKRDAGKRDAGAAKP